MNDVLSEYGVNGDTMVGIDVEDTRKKRGIVLNIVGYGTHINRCMKLNDLLLERISQSHPVIIVDVQPAYHKWCQHITPYIVSLLHKQSGKVLVYFNGDSTGLTADTAHDVMRYFVEHGLDERKLDNIDFVEKEYGFFAAWNVETDEHTIISVLREMNRQRVTDSRDLDEGTLEEIAGDDYPRYDPIYFPDIDISKLKEMNGALLCGGGKHECLKEIQLLMSVYNIKYKESQRLIY